jgi:hypothetical protein
MTKRASVEMMVFYVLSYGDSIVVSPQQVFSFGGTVI